MGSGDLGCFHTLDSQGCRRIYIYIYTYICICTRARRALHCMQRAQIWIVIHAIREVSENQQIFRKDHDPLSNLGYDEVWETTSPNIDCNALGSALRARLHGAGPAPQLVGKCWLKVRGNVVGSVRGDVSLSWKRWLHRCSQRGPRRLAGQCRLRFV